MKRFINSCQNLYNFLENQNVIRNSTGFNLVHLHLKHVLQATKKRSLNMGGRCTCKNTNKFYNAHYFKMYQTEYRNSPIYLIFLEDSSCTSSRKCTHHYKEMNSIEYFVFILVYKDLLC
jgi:hypothetical protein